MKIHITQHMLHFLLPQTEGRSQLCEADGQTGTQLLQIHHFGCKPLWFGFSRHVSEPAVPFPSREGSSLSLAETGDVHFLNISLQMEPEVLVMSHKALNGPERFGLGVSLLSPAGKAHRVPPASLGETVAVGEEPSSSFSHYFIALGGLWYLLGNP